MAKYDIGTAASGALTGAYAGSMFGPIGTGVGALAGGALGLFGSKKKKKKPNRLSAFDPLQQELYNSYYAGLNGQGNQADLFKFDPQQANDVFDQNVARPAYRGFQENIVPTITGQYRSNNLMDSSYSAQALSRAGRDVQEGLDAQRAATLYQGSQASLGRRQDAIERLLNTSTFAYDNPEQPRSTVDQVLGTVAPHAGDWFADYLQSRRKTPPAQVPNPAQG